MNKTTLVGIGLRLYYLFHKQFMVKVNENGEIRLDKNLVLNNGEFGLWVKQSRGVYLEGYVKDDDKGVILLFEGKSDGKINAIVQSGVKILMMVRDEMREGI